MVTIGLVVRDFCFMQCDYMTYLKEILGPNLLNDFFLQSGNLLGYTNSNGATTAQNIFWNVSKELLL